jgi:nicotinamide-nucleotide amidase
MNKSIYEIVFNKLKEKDLKISFCESCTGGNLVASLVKFPGASNILEESYVTYSENAKQKIVGVKKETLDKYTVYSKEVASEMAMGLFKISNSDLCVAISGTCGDNSVSNNKADLAIYYKGIMHNYVLESIGTRIEVLNDYIKKVYEYIDLVL